MTGLVNIGRFLVVNAEELQIVSCIARQLGLDNANRWVSEPGSASRSLLQVADEHHVGFPVAADDGELFAVEGEIEVADELGFEIGQLLTGRSVEILQPEIVGLAVAYGIDDPFAVGAESDRPDGEAEIKLRAKSFKFETARGLVGIEEE